MRAVPLVVLIACSLSGLAAGAERSYDVLVYGATPGGVAAAIAAAREGADVALVEPQALVGGMMSGGLSFSDSNQTDRRTLGGLFEEIHLRIERHYAAQGVALPYRVAEKNHDPWTYEPHVAEQVFGELLTEAGVDVFLDQRLVAVQVEDAVIRSLETDADRFLAEAFVDAAYEGDLMAASGASWTIGREARSEFDESYAGRQFPKSPVVGVDPHDESGAVLPLMTGQDSGDAEAGDRRPMVYSFRLCLTKAADRVPIEKPANYDPAQFELVRRFVAAHPPQRPLLDLYALPGDKFDGNNSIGGQISIGLVGASENWCEATHEERERIRQAHRDYTQGLLWFMASDLAMPATLRAEVASLGYARDEFERFDHFPPVLYVREGRRMIGEYVLTQRDVLDDVTKSDSVGVGSFPIDSHDVQRVPTADRKGFVNEGTIFPVRLPGRRMGSPHQLPYRAILPKRDEVRNLLVPVALSATHVAFSSVRVEPTWMVLGQSAGVAAALAVQRDEPVQDVPYDILRERLVAQRQILELLPLPPLPAPAEAAGIAPESLPGIVLDDRDAELVGGWQRSTNFRPFVGVGYIHDGDAPTGELRATFRPDVPRAGRYAIRLAYSPHPTRAGDVPMTVDFAGARRTFPVDLRMPLDEGSPFRTVATLDLPAGRKTAIEFSNDGATGFVVIDALQILAADPKP